MAAAGPKSRARKASESSEERRSPVTGMEPRGTGRWKREGKQAGKRPRWQWSDESAKLPKTQRSEPAGLGWKPACGRPAC